MSQYVEYVADFLLEMLGYDKLYRSRNPVSENLAIVTLF